MHGKVIHKLIQTRDLGATLDFSFSWSLPLWSSLVTMSPSHFMHLFLHDIAWLQAYYQDSWNSLLPRPPSPFPSPFPTGYPNYSDNNRLFAAVILKKRLSFSIIGTI